MSNENLPVIGKNVIETLTSGMYEDARFIYREYIQNSADQIDIAVEKEILPRRSNGAITISIDSTLGTIVIHDNATGISVSKIRGFLGDVANSEKDVTKRKGFRGIGRLGGLGYCNKLIFETSFKGEAVKSIMTLNAKMLREIISNRKDSSDAAQVISIITTIESSYGEIDEHYFKVTLIDVVRESVLLNVPSVLEYLSMVAPVPFSDDFRYKADIVNHFEGRNIPLDEYTTFLNGTPIYKAYKNKLVTGKESKASEITSLDFFNVWGDEEQLLAIGWYAISNRVNEVIDQSNTERGIRIRKNNIAIGNEQTLFKRFKADRTNLRYIGEIHTVSDGFIPNARRDYFNDNKTLEQFEKSLNTIFKPFESILPHKASDLHNRLKNIRQFRELADAYRGDSVNFETPKQQEQRLNEVMSTFNGAKSAERIISRIKDEGESNAQIKALYKSIIKKYDYTIHDDELNDLLGDKIYPPIPFSKVSPEQAELLNEIVMFLQDELGHKTAESLIRKLKQKYD